ncbi:MAG: membrane associated rhomboid family serine protease [Flavobacteriaceae bacterium]|jgi:membrane associated rhomboid family serine protease
MKQHQFGSPIEAIAYPAVLLVLMWLVFWADHLFPDIPFYHWGVIPKDLDTLQGVLLMPLLHAKNDIGHIMNNSVPTGILLAALIYYYRDIAGRVFIISWLLTGLGLFVFAENTSSYHIGMSGVVYALAAFLFTSGILRKYRPLQAIALFVAFVYGSMIWGIFPTDAHVSWEGHLSGMVTGIVLAIIYRKRGPQPPKYIYEIEKELGIDPPDFEGEWNERLRQQQLQQQLQKEARERRENGHVIVYHYVPNKDDATEQKPSDDTDQQ